jgi:hypothetical protein
MIPSVLRIAATWLALSATAVLVAGCGGGKVQTATKSSASTGEPPSCVVGLREKSLRITFAGLGANRYCPATIRSLSRGTESWEARMPVASAGAPTLTPICQVFKEPVSAAIEGDARGAGHGAGVLLCVRLIKAGWAQHTLGPSVVETK